MMAVDTVEGSAADAGDLRFKAEPDFEDPKDANKDNTYEVTLNVSDGTGTATLDVRVTVNNVVVIPDGLPDNSAQEAVGDGNLLPPSAPRGRRVRRHPQGR